MLIGSVPIVLKSIRASQDIAHVLQIAELQTTLDNDLINDNKSLLEQQEELRKAANRYTSDLDRCKVLVDSVTGICLGELDGQTLAIFRGRLVRYRVRSRMITIGRCSKDYDVDVGLRLEGPAHKVSRKHATLRLSNTGQFLIKCDGKRAILVDDRAITTGHEARVYDNSVVEIANLQLVFAINHDLIRRLYNSTQCTV